MGPDLGRLGSQVEPLGASWGALGCTLSAHWLLWRLSGRTWGNQKLSGRRSDPQEHHFDSILELFWTIFVNFWGLPGHFSLQMFFQKFFLLSMFARIYLRGSAECAERLNSRPEETK